METRPGGRFGTISIMPQLRQRSVFDVLIADTQPINSWLASIERLIPVIYPHDHALSRTLDLAVRQLRSSASDLDCARTDDPSAPLLNAPAVEFLAWFFANQPEFSSSFRRQLARVDQLLGRTLLLKTVHGN